MIIDADTHISPTGEDAVAITFDDGYAENCRQAIPLLVRNQIPCTYFVTLENVLEGKPFAHDVAHADRFPPTAYCRLPSANCPLLAAHCLLPAACCLLPAACCLLPAACCLLPAACCPPSHTQTEAC